MRDDNGNLAILLVYIITAVCALASFVLPNLYKLTEASNWVDEHHAVLERLLHESKLADDRGSEMNQSSHTLRRSQELPREQEVGSGSSSP